MQKKSHIRFPFKRAKSSPTQRPKIARDEAHWRLRSIIGGVFFHYFFANHLYVTICNASKAQYYKLMEKMRVEGVLTNAVFGSIATFAPGQISTSPCNVQDTCLSVRCCSCIANESLSSYLAPARDASFKAASPSRARNIMALPSISLSTICNYARPCCHHGSWCHPWHKLCTPHCWLESQGERRPVTCRVLRRDIPVVNFRPGTCTAEDRGGGMGCVGQDEFDNVCLAVRSKTIVDHALHACSVHEGT